MAKVFVGSIPSETSEDVVKAEFAKFGPIVNFYFKRDTSGPQRSWAFVTYQEQDIATRAIEATGAGKFTLPGASTPCDVSWARSAQAAMTSGAVGNGGIEADGLGGPLGSLQLTAGTSQSPFHTPVVQAGPTKLFVGSIPAGTTKEMLSEEFAKLGQVAEVFLKNDATDPGRMWGFVTYVSPEGAALAVATLNEKMVFPSSTRPLAVSFARSSSSPTAASTDSGMALAPVAAVGGGIGPTKLFVGSIPAGTTREIVKAEFEKFGAVTDVFLKNDASEPSRMWGFVTYQDAASAALAVPALNERLVLPGGSRACAVSFAKNSQAQHSMAAQNLTSTTSLGLLGAPLGAMAPSTKLFLGTIPVGTTEAILRREFERFGMVTEVFLKNDAADASRMWGFLTYADPQSAAMAVSTLHEKLMLPGSTRPIAVSFARSASGSGAIPTTVAPPSLAGTIAGLGGAVGVLASAGVDHGWKVYYNADGIPYYHHAATNRTQWEMPPELGGPPVAIDSSAFVATGTATTALPALTYGNGIATAATAPATVAAVAPTTAPAGMSAGFGGLDPGYGVVAATGVEHHRFTPY